MRIIALMNQKGGVGKTTTTVNLGAALAEAGKRVLLIDLDPQAHLTINYGIDPNPEKASLYDVLVDEKPLADAMQPAGERIQLVASSIDLAAAEIELVSVMGREMILRKRLEAIGEQFDFVLLDCPPSLGLLTINSLAAAGEVIIPMQPHFLAMQGVAKLLETVQLVNKRMNPKLKVAGIVLTMFDAQTKLSSEVVAELQRFIEEAKGQPLPWAEAKIFSSKIRRNIKLAECPSFGQPVTAYDPASNGAADYRSLAREVLALGGETVAEGGAAAAAEKKPAAKPAFPKPAAKAPAEAAHAKKPEARPKTVVQPVKKAVEPAESAAAVAVNHTPAADVAAAKPEPQGTGSGH